MSGRTLLLVGHGSHLNGNSSAPLYAHAERLRASPDFDEVKVATWKEEPSLSRALDGCDSADVTVVPLFISDGYFTGEVIPREMSLDGPLTRRDGRIIRLTAPIGAHPSLADVIVERAIEQEAKPGDVLAVLGHGTPRNPRSERNVFDQAERVRARGRFADVVTVFLDQEPNMRDLRRLVPERDIIVVPLFVADGWHVGETIPDDLALDGPTTRADGRVIRYAGAVGTHPSIVDVILELARDAAAWT